MKYPGIGAYTDAMASIDMTVLDSVLSGGDVENNSWGMPLARSGSFAWTFKITTRTGDYAFRLFQTERKGMQKRYKAISDELAAHPNKFFVDFEYLTQGIRVEGDTFPAIRMRWADGEPLGVYIENHVKDAQRLRVLQSNIGKLASSMENAGIAHGDIQMGNVLVQSNGAVMLVDYDGMFVPGLANMVAVEVGMPNFQHPERSQIQPFDATLDRFSFALIHTGLGALIEKPDLWTTFHADSDALLFRGKDLAEPSASTLFTQLNTLPVTGVFSQRLASLANASYLETPTVSDFLSGTNIPAGVTRTKSARATGAVTSKSTSNIPWYLEPIVTHSSSAQSDSEPEYETISMAEDIACILDARKVEEVFDYAGERVMLVGRINQVDTTVGSASLPAVELILSPDGEEDQIIYVKVTTGGVKNFAAEGTTIDESWESSWVVVIGTLSEISPELQPRYVSIDVRETENLRLTNYNEARKIIAGHETQHTFSSFHEPSQSPTQTPPQEQASSNDDLVSNLSGSKPSTTNMPTSTTTPVRPATPLRKAWGGRIWVWLLPVGLLVALALAIGIAIAIGNSSSSDSNTSSEPTISTGFDRLVSSYEGTCVMGSARGAKRAVPCDDPLAKFRVVEIGTPGYVCSTGQLRQEMRPNGVLCLELIEPVDPVKPLEVVESVEPVSLETCIETTISRGEKDGDCFPGERWEILSKCGKGLEDAVLQQRKNGKWVTVKRNISTKDGCSGDKPWKLDFSRKASGMGVKPYRIYKPETSFFNELILNIIVTVKEK